MEKTTSVRHGDVLLLLVHRSQMQKQDVAAKLDIHANSLSRLFKSEKITLKVRKKAAELFDVPLSIFEDPGIARQWSEIQEVSEPEVVYKPKELEGMDAAEVLRHLEAKDRRHHEERMRLLVIIENLTKK